MVTLTAGPGPVFNMGTRLGADWEVGPASTTPTVVEIGDKSSSWYRLTGNGFADTDGDGRPDSGTVATMEFWYGANRHFTLSGLSIDFMDLEAAYHDGTHLFAMLLAGDDVIQGSPLDDWISGYGGDDEMHGHGGSDTLEGSEGDDRLFGGAGDDDLLGQGGEDELSGGEGDDFLDVTGSTKFVVDGGAGLDIWYGNLSALSSGLTIDSAAAASDAGLAIGPDRLVRRIENMTIQLGSGNDIFRDRADGGNENIGLGYGNDKAYVSSGVDQVIAWGRRPGDAAGLDELFIDYSGAAAGLRSELGANRDATYHLVWEGPGYFDSATRSIASVDFDRVTLTATGFADRLVGSAASDRIVAGGGDDVLTAQVGNDVLEGGDGSDTLNFYFTSFVFDPFFLGSLTPALASGASIDLALTTAQAMPNHFVFASGAFVPRSLGTVTLRQVENVDGTGLADSFRGDSGANRLAGLAGNDFLDGRGGNDDLRGGEGDDILIGGTGNDRLDGGAGTDTVSYASATAAVTVSLAATGAQNTGGGGTDTLAGIENALSGSGNDRLTGNSAANLLNGGAGADTMTGGSGGDLYVVDNGGDRAIETSSAGGTDSVQSSVTFTLGAYVENLTLTGSAAINGSGNALANVLTGNGAANLLNGDRGADTMTGGGGNDHYVVNDSGDQVIEASAGGGLDKVSSSISYTLGANLEYLTLLGTAAVDGTGNALGNSMTGNSSKNRLDGRDGADRLYGGGGADTLMGGSGDDRLYGGSSSDILTGGGGRDGYYFDALLGTANVDTITDFSALYDTILLDRDVFAGLAGDGALTAGAFRNGTAAVDADDRILYDPATGAIRYDPDGAGGAAAILFAQVTAGTALTSADFVGYV